MSLNRFIEGVSKSSAIADVVLSPSATQVIYRLVPLYRPSDRYKDVASLWISSLQPGSRARQITSGTYNDSAPTWSHDESEVYFLSNRHELYSSPGPAAIYVLPLVGGGEVYSLTNTERKSAVSGLAGSADGRYLLYTSSRDPTEEEEKKMLLDKDDAEVWGDTRENDQLWLLTLATRQVRRLNLGPYDAWNVVNACWSPDSKELMVQVDRSCTLDIGDHTTSLIRVSIKAGDENKVEYICDFSKTAAWATWPSMDRLVLTRKYIQDELISSRCLYTCPASPEAADIQGWSRYYGEVDDALDIFDLDDSKTIAIVVAEGVQSRIDLLDISTNTTRILWKSVDQAPGTAYDVGRTKDGAFVVAMVRSSGVAGEPNELWTGTITPEELDAGAMLKLTDKLSSYNAWAEDLPKLSMELVQYTAADGTLLDGIVTWPKDKERKDLPTILLPHGGPYARDMLEMDVEYVLSKELFALAGYLVLCPQYRGGQGYGDAFTRVAKDDAERHDWADCRALLDHAVAQGWADKDRLGLAGWSSGGFLTAWGVGQTKDLFKAAIMGAGVSDYVALALDGIGPDFPSDYAGCSPWSGHRKDEQVSPIAHVKGVKTPVLIIHGKDDAIVPVSQGIGYHRALRRMSANPESHQLVLYPREGHSVKEQKHAVDMMRRMVEWMDSHLK